MNPPNPPSQPGDASASGDEVAVLTHAGTRENRKRSDIRAHDFRQSGFLTPSELRRIRLRHEQFVRALAGRMAIFLRLEFTVQTAKVQIVGYQKFIESLQNPTHITLFKADPLKGVGLLVIPPRLGLMIVDRLLGGPGSMPETNRELSEIETALTDQVAMLLLSEWCNHWPEMRDLKPALLDHESNSRFLQTAPADTAMLVLTMNSGIGDKLEPIQLLFPYATVEPLMRLLNPPMPESEAAPARADKPKWNAEFNDVKVPITAEWHGLKMSAGDITRLKSGDVVMLDPQCAAQVHLRFSHLPKFVGRPGTRSGKWAVQLTSPITT
ncbi:MAG TPA: FliM/FliN family flagellar motor switch protein [Verrucomicrobiae bacterium]|jgi:flagellar motor switch protein FliM|nr:FliM/FliN family flagellar motor switch protein [Verrucomicrobiae bacterium]